MAVRLGQSLGIAGLVFALLILTGPVSAGGVEISNRHFERDGQWGFDVISREGSHQAFWVVYCESDSRGPSVVSFYPDFENPLHDEVDITPFLESPTNADADDYELWHSFCKGVQGKYYDGFD